MAAKKEKKKKTDKKSLLKKRLKHDETGNAAGLPEKELNESVSQLFEEGGDVMATLAQKWKRSGKKEGKEEGIKETKWDVVKNSLKEGLPIQTIERITGLPLEEINRFKETHAHPA